MPHTLGIVEFKDWLEEYDDVSTPWYEALGIKISIQIKTGDEDTDEGLSAEWEDCSCIFESSLINFIDKNKLKIKVIAPEHAVNKYSGDCSHYFIKEK